MGKWLAAPMKNSIGTESQVLVRDARNARRAQRGCSAGAGVPAAAAIVAAMIFFCRGQMIIQTFMNMTVPSPPPIRIESRRLLAPHSRP
jgi:hypothetical protein